MLSANPRTGVGERVVAGLSALVLLAALLIGGSRENALQLALVELLSLPLLGVALWRLLSRPLTAPLRAALILLLAIAAIPLLQLIALPPAVWSNLPGRDELAQSMRLGGGVVAWPLSLTPQTTAANALALLPPFALFLGVSQLQPARQLQLARLIVLVAVASVVLGIFQTLGPAAEFPPYRSANRGLPIGFFANRNHQADFLLCAIPFAAAWSAALGQRDGPGRLLPLGSLILIMTGVAGTLSRSGVLLLAPTLVVSLIVLSGSARLLRNRSVLVAAACAGVAASLIGYFTFAAIEARFDLAASPEFRAEAWPLIADLVGATFPFGTGLGSFDVVYRAAEPLQMVRDWYFNNAHNDYLELTLETGIIFPILFAAFLAWFGWVGARAWRSSGPAAALARAASVVVGVVLLHSIVDYPLRTLALACVFAVACGVLVGAGRTSSTPARTA